MWALHESYDPTTHAFYLDLVSEPGAAPLHSGLEAPKLLEKFENIEDARRFADEYIKALTYKDEQVVREVRCGQHRLNGCNGPGKPCYLGLDAYHCRIREGS